jgi:hypothetical protein
MFPEKSLAQQHIPSLKPRRSDQRGANASCLAVLEGDFDRVGVRCQDSRIDEGPTLVESLITARPETDPRATFVDARNGTIESALDDIDTTPRRIVPGRTDEDPRAQRSRRLLFTALVVGSAIALGASGAWLLPVGGHHRTLRAASAANLSTRVTTTAISALPESRPAPEPIPAAPAALDETAATEHVENSDMGERPPEPATVVDKPKKSGGSQRAWTKKHHADVAQAAHQRARGSQIPRPRAGRLSLDEF